MPTVRVNSNHYGGLMEEDSNVVYEVLNFIAMNVGKAANTDYVQAKKVD